MFCLNFMCLCSFIQELWAKEEEKNLLFPKSLETKITQDAHKTCWNKVIFSTFCNNNNNNNNNNNIKRKKKKLKITFYNSGGYTKTIIKFMLAHDLWNRKIKNEKFYFQNSLCPFKYVFKTKIITSLDIFPKVFVRKNHLACSLLIRM